MKKNIKKNIKKIVGLFLLTPYYLFAQSAGGSGISIPNPLNRTDNIFGLIRAVLDFVTKVGAAIVVFMVIYSGFLFVQAQGDPGKIKTAKNVFFWTVIGGVVLLGAQVLASVICNTALQLGVTGLSC
jgi:hypothetical protein